MTSQAHGDDGFPAVVWSCWAGNRKILLRYKSVTSEKILAQWFQLAAEWQSGSKKTSSLRVLKTNSDDLPLTFPSLSGRASQDAATEVGFPFSGQTSKFSGALAGAVKQPYAEEASEKS